MENDGELGGVGGSGEGGSKDKETSGLTAAQLRKINCAHDRMRDKNLKKKAKKDAAAEKAAQRATRASKKKAKKLCHRLTENARTIAGVSAVGTRRGKHQRSWPRLVKRVKMPWIGTTRLRWSRSCRTGELDVCFICALH